MTEGCRGPTDRSRWSHWYRRRGRTRGRVYGSQSLASRHPGRVLREDSRSGRDRPWEYMGLIEVTPSAPTTTDGWCRDPRQEARVPGNRVYRRDSEVSVTTSTRAHGTRRTRLRLPILRTIRSVPVTRRGIGPLDSGPGSPWPTPESQPTDLRVPTRDNPLL